MCLGVPTDSLSFCFILRTYWTVWRNCRLAFQSLFTVAPLYYASSQIICLLMPISVIGCFMVRRVLIAARYSFDIRGPCAVPKLCSSPTNRFPELPSEPPPKKHTQHVIATLILPSRASSSSLARPDRTRYLLPQTLL